MYFLTSLKAKCISNANFPKKGIFLIDELFTIFEHSKEDKLQLLNDERISACIITVTKELKMEKLVQEAYKLAHKDPIFNGVFFDYDCPIIENINNYFNGKGILPASLSEIFIKIVEKTRKDNKGKLSAFKGYELAGAIALFYIRKAFRITNKSYRKSMTKKSLNSLTVNDHAKMRQADAVRSSKSDPLHLL
ncbi:hypothetical protein, partial [Muribacter muris]